MCSSGLVLDLRFRVLARPLCWGPRLWVWGPKPGFWIWAWILGQRFHGLGLGSWARFRLPVPP